MVRTAPRYGSTVSPQTPATTTRQTVPWLIRNGLCTMLVVAAFVSMPFIGEYGPLPTTAMLDAWMILLVLTCFFWGRIYPTFALGLLALYLLTRIVPGLYTESPIVDFLQAYKWLLYLVAFVFAVGREWGPVRGLVRVMWVLLSLAFLKSTVTFAVYGAGERPGLLIENNFEIALFAGLVIVLYRFLGRGRIWVILLMGGLIVLSGSRSGAIAFLVLALFAITQVKNASLLVKYMLVLLAPALAIVPVWIFEQRSGGGGQVDRLNFFDVFLAETSKWDALNWIFGTTPITPLSAGSCSRLSFYQQLFSSEGDGTCYSVILHAFLMRVVFDAGVLGLLIAFGVAWWMMRRASVQFGVAVALIAVAITNSLSVSGLNNPYVALPILLSIVTVTSLPEDHREPRQRHARLLMREGQARWRASTVGTRPEKQLS